MNAGNTTFCVVDHGLFLPLAERLGRDAKRVLYYSPHEDGFPTLAKCCLGDGYENVERCDDIWKAKSEVDIFVFPDIGYSGLQKELVSQGFPVWGSRAADTFETDREKFLKTIKKLGLEVPVYEVVKGLTELRVWCSEHDGEEWYVKISRYRGNMETWRFKNSAEAIPKLDALAMQFGPFQEFIRFVVVKKIDTDLEFGIDTYCVHGQFPKLVTIGPEIKDQCYLTSFREMDEVDERLRVVNEAWSPILEQEGYANFHSSEVRIAGDKSFFLDPTHRCPSPAIETQLELYANLPEIIIAGAHGELVEPEKAAEFAAECAVTIKTAGKGAWSVAEVPDKVRQWFKASRSCEVDGRLCWPPEESAVCDAGWLVAIGDTIEDTIDALHEHAEALKDTPLKVDCSALYDALKEIQSAKDEGVEITDEDIPEPEVALES